MKDTLNTINTINTSIRLYHWIKFFKKTIFLINYSNNLNDSKNMSYKRSYANVLRENKNSKLF